MKMISLKPHIYRFDDFKTFAKEFELSGSDLVLTHEFLYRPYMEALGLKCTFAFQEKYGSGEPSDEMIDRIIANHSLDSFDRIIAIGGGTVIDIAKILALGGVTKSSELFEKHISPVKKRKLLIVPTTCGTGSEVTNISIAEVKHLHTKLGLVGDSLYPDHAVLIPKLLENLPYPFFVYSSIDALIHAMESMLSPKANIYTELYSTAAINKILEGYAEILEKGQEHRKNLLENFLIASNYAGIAFANTGVGAVHALSYPLGGVYHVPHGEANYQFLIEVFNLYYALNPNGKIKELIRLIAGKIGGAADGDTFDRLGDFLNDIIKAKKLSEYGMKKEEIELFSQNVIEKQQRLLVNSYVPIALPDIINIYKNLYQGVDL
jgi:4-hydroxybutyrate dehydrogenase